MSIASAVMVVVFIFFKWRIVYAVGLSVFSYYCLFVGKEINVAFAMAIFTTIFPFLFSHLFIRLYQQYENKSYSIVISLYFVVIGVLLPLSTYVTAMIISFFAGSEPLAFNFMAYSILGGMLTQLSLTPSVLVLFLLVFTKLGYKSKYLEYSSEIRQSKNTDPSYLLWLSTFIIITVVAISYHNALVSYSLCFVLLILVILGFGRFGLVQPLMMATFVTLVMLTASLERANTMGMLDEQFYGLLVVLAVMLSLCYAIALSVIKNFELLRQQIKLERIDPYTELFNIKQLEEDLSEQQQAVIVYLDLMPTMSKLSELGYQGKAQLIFQLNNYLTVKNKNVFRCYRPPFSIGILGFAISDENIDSKLNVLVSQLKRFQFYWGDTSVSLVSPTLHCAKITQEGDISAVVSQLCGQPSALNTSIHWVEEQAPLVSKVDMLEYIQNVFKNNLFELNCQPYLKLNGKKEKGHSFEVLLRINPQDGMTQVVTPAEFFPMINLFELESELDRWVVTHTFKLLNEHITDWKHIEKCAINLTAKSLSSPTLAKDIIQLAERYTIPLKRICFEITESSALQSEEQAIETIQLLRRAGSKIALDDFGTGYASFSYLRRLPLDILKIDGEFIRDLPVSETDRLIVESLSNVAKDIGLETVAEFVETEEHINLVKLHDITYAQGYGVAKPRPLKAFLIEIMRK
ncbi:EAL domain-containing protein [Photobacterium sp. Ph5]|nr:EAL domain-containing protein [Photobacterium sp. Ph6]MCG3874900.1 EAL domain-containing protein [Photobacterium sp. Ph5]